MKGKVICLESFYGLVASLLRVLSSSFVERCAGSIGLVRFSGRMLNY